jgi:hypothetical protein
MLAEALVTLGYVLAMHLHCLTEPHHGEKLKTAKRIMNILL